MPEEIQRFCHVLGIASLKELQTLPHGALCRRFGKLADQLERRIFGQANDVFNIEIPPSPDQVSLDLDDPTSSLEVLLFLHKSLLDRLTCEVKNKRLVIACLQLGWQLADRTVVERQFRPAQPTLSSRCLLDLLGLWFRQCDLPAEVLSISLSAVEVGRATARQLALFDRQQQVAEEAFDSALAQLVAMFGERSVVTPELSDTFLPEQRIVWRDYRSARLSTAQKITAHTPVSQSLPPAIRLFDPPRKLTWDRKRKLFFDADTSYHVRRTDGPFHLQGQWWHDTPFNRQYILVHTDQDELLLLFWEDKRWHLQGLFD